jgi:hypothetical protein
MFEDMTKLMALNEWDEEATQNMVSHMKGLAAIDARESSSEALNMYFEFRPRWTRFLQDHPDIAEMIDPVYVVACITPGVPLPVWPGVPAGAPLGPLTALHGSAYAWNFANERRASFWCGVIRAVVPAMRLWMFTCPSPCVHW